MGTEYVYLNDNDCPDRRMGDQYRRAGSIEWGTTNQSGVQSVSELRHVYPNISYRRPIAVEVGIGTGKDWRIAKLDEQRLIITRQEQEIAELRKAVGDLQDLLVEANRKLYQVKEALVAGL
jgi:hypothetical protein